MQEDKNEKEKEHLKLVQDQLKLSLETTQEFFDMWTKSYQSTFGKLAQMPTFGPVREKQEKMMKIIPLYTDLYATWIESNINLQSVFSEATKRTYEKTIEKLAKMPDDLKNDNTKNGIIDQDILKDFYRTWIDTYSDTFKEFLKSGHFSSDMGKLSSIFMDSQKYNREIIEENYLKPNNLPTKSDIDQMNKELYDLKKIVKALTKELQELKKQANSLKSENLEKSENPSDMIKNKLSDKEEISPK